ncbi:unnamed protein product, partial [Porites evermanni]
FNVSDANIIESLFVEIFIARHKNRVIGVIYRPPSENTLEFIEKIISGVTKGNKHCYITGDFNLDVLKHESHSVTAQFIESLFCFWFSASDYKTHKNYSTFHDAYRQHFYEQYYSILIKWFDHK